MPIQVDRNPTYGPPLVSQKYSPLLNIQYALADRPIYDGMLNNRYNLLRNSNLIPQDLKLLTPSWANATLAELAHSPPLIVISSNRSKWIKAGIDAAAAELAGRNLVAFANASDLRALTAERGQTVSPPIYSPARIGANRNVYIVVHASEYNTYKTNLAGTGISIVGWQFVLPVTNRAPRNVWICGFGASRFAAIEFCRRLRARAAVAAAGVAPWNYAWLLDDNCVAFTNFAGFAAVEAAMTPATACAGFQGGTKAESFATNRDWARAEINAGRGVAVGALPVSAPPGILQQAVLWNISYLAANFLNFGPVFIASGEDVSIGNYFDDQHIPYLYYGGITVRKEDAGSDNSGGATKVNAARQRLASWFSQGEGVTVTPPGGQAPPPITITPAQNTDGGNQTVGNFVMTYALPNSAMRAEAGKVSTQNTAKVQAVEQMTCGALSLGHIAAGTLTRTFRINGAATAQVVQEIDQP